MSFNSQYNSVFGWMPENGVQHYDPNINISDNPQLYYFEDNSENMTIDQINENQKRPHNSYMSCVGFDDQERAVKMAKIDESGSSTYGESALMAYRDSVLSSSYDESFYGDHNLLTYDNQNLLTYDESGLPYNYVLSPFINDNTSIVEQQQQYLQEYDTNKTAEQLSLQEYDTDKTIEQLSLQEYDSDETIEQSSLQNERLSLQEIGQYEVANGLPSQEIKQCDQNQLFSEESKQYETDEQSDIKFVLDEQSSLEDIQPYKINDTPSLQDIITYRVDEQSSSQELKCEINEQSLQNLKYEDNDQLSLQDLKFEVNEQSSINSYQIDQKDTKSESECEVIDLTGDTDDDSSSPITSTPIDKIKQESVLPLMQNNFFSSLKLSQLSQSPLYNRNTLFQTVNSIPFLNNISSPIVNSPLSSNVNSPLSSNVINTNALLNFNNPTSLNENKPTQFDRPATYSRPINLQVLLDMIPLDESNQTPVGVAMRKINARKGIVPGLSIQLMNHQVIGVSWMVDQEIKENVRGGILADDMGLGKTVQTIATIVINRPDAKKTKSAKATLIVAPTALIHQWKNEILNKTDQDLFSVHVYHGQNKASFHNLKKFDIVITTYQTLLRECPESDEDDRGSLFRMEWFRIVLDEAQNIKNRNSRASKACAFLTSIYRWCLTGTPIQNHIDDLYPYFRFLDIANFSDWPTFHEQLSSASQKAIRKAQTILRGILLRRTKDSKLDGQPLLVLPNKTVSFVKKEFSKDEREFYDALEKRSRIEFNRYLKEGSVLKNYAYILVMLLRLRQACNHPFLTQEDIGHVIASAEDQRLLRPPTSSNSYCQNIPNQLERAKKILSDKVITRLFDKYKDKNSSNDECPICYDLIDHGIVTSCGHVFCLDCIKSAIDSENKENVIDVEDRKCPFCRSLIKERDFISLDVFIPPTKIEPHSDDDDLDLPTLAESLKAISSSSNGSNDSLPSPEGISEQKSNNKNNNNNLTGNTFANALEGSFMSSTKIDQLMTELALAQEEDPGCKTIVFSQWTSMLDLVETPIKSVGYKFCRYDGTMDVKERENSLQKLMHDAEITIMLVSLKAGGVGLNLTKANRVIMLDCWWNPAVEDQAVDRVHRIGQFKDVIIKRLTIQNSIEDRILILQDKKRELAAGALGEGSIKVGRLTVEDLIFLFR